MCTTDNKDILHKLQQCYWRDVYQISLWSVEYAMKKSITKFYWFSNSVEISLVGQAPGK